MNNLYLVSRPDSDRIGYDEYDSMVVAAESEVAARLIHPRSGGEWRRVGILGGYWVGRDQAEDDDWADKTWAPPATLVVVMIGVAITDIESGTVICSSFNAG